MNFDKKALVSDLLKVATFNIVAHYLMHVRFGDALFDEKFIYSLVFILLGFALYHVVIAGYIKNLLSKNLVEHYRYYRYWYYNRWGELRWYWY
jgi:hypothetical protein